VKTAVDSDGLRREMARKGLTGAELASLAGVTGATVSHALGGRRVSYLTIRALARALTLTPDMPMADVLFPTKTETAASTATVSTEDRRVSAETP
jgi:transcriptional regulator with XRE-family HTH domain